MFSIFFKREFAASVFYDCRASEEASLDNPLITNTGTPEFFQTLHNIDGALQSRLVTLLSILEKNGYDADEIDEHLLYLLRQLIHVHHMEAQQAMRVSAIKQSNKTEVYKRLCSAKDVLHSSFTDKLDLDTISAVACLSMPQLIRQFKLVFHCTRINT